MMSVTIAIKASKQYLRENGGVYDETMKLFFHRRESMYFSYQRERQIWSFVLDQPSFITLVNFPGFC